jgi:hypothetical protein
MKRIDLHLKQIEIHEDVPTDLINEMYISR